MLNFPRSVNQEVFYYILGRFYEDYGDDVYENETFIYRPYDWNFDGEDSERPANLEHKASGFKLWWYKYPLRSPEVNMMITSKQFVDILYDCHDSIYKNAVHDIEKWWESAGGGC